MVVPGEFCLEVGDDFSLSTTGSLRGGRGAQGLGQAMLLGGMPRSQKNQYSQH